MQTEMSSKEIICQGEELFRLIPQRPPMVMIDRFYGIEENTSWSGLTVTPDNLFCRDGVLQETGIIEHITINSISTIIYCNF
jgi:3-hydroxymyristoyl/3-hydroxydecanoyl-(acyl carrier protein) dehydratase